MRYVKNEYAQPPLRERIESLLVDLVLAAGAIALVLVFGFLLGYLS